MTMCGLQEVKIRRLTDARRFVYSFAPVLSCLIQHHSESHVACWGAGIAQWLEYRTRDRKFPGLSPGRSGGRIFFSRVDFLC